MFSLMTAMASAVTLKFNFGRSAAPKSNNQRKVTFAPSTTVREIPRNNNGLKVSDFRQGNFPNAI